MFLNVFLLLYGKGDIYVIFIIYYVLLRVIVRYFKVGLIIKVGFFLKFILYR